MANPTQKREITKAEILEEMTFALRRAMTEILLEVTNEEITGIASDIIKSETGKKSKKSVRKSGLQGTYCLPHCDYSNDKYLRKIQAPVCWPFDIFSYVEQ